MSIQLLMQKVLLIQILAQLSHAATIFSYTCASDNCSFCSVNTVTASITCLRCEYGYKLNSSNACVAVTCASGQYVSTLGQCLACHSSCKSCKGMGTDACVECKSSYFAVYSTTYEGLSQCQRCNDKNCLACDRFGTCEVCATGYTLSSSTTTMDSCVKCTIPYAASCSTSTTVNACITGYYKSDTGTSCLPSITENTCDVGYYLDSNQLCQQCTTGCIHCSSATNCYVCDDKQYVTLSGTCSSCSANCLECTGSAACTTCKDGYFALSGICQLITSANVVTCPVGEYPDWVHNVCIRCAIGCYSCDQVTGACLICYDQATNQVNATTGVCERICATTTQYFSQSEIALADILVLQSLGQPILLSSTAISSGSCVASSISTLTCASPAYSASTCAMCTSTYTLYLGTCVTSCPTGYFKQTDKTTTSYVCRKCPRGCSACSSLKYCSACEADFSFATSTCQVEEVHPVNTIVLDDDYVVFDGLYLLTCPKTTIQIGSRCILMSTCKNAHFRADIKDIICDTCQQPSNVIPIGFTASPPALNVPWFGKCYTDCPTGTAGCIAPCKAPTLQSKYNNGQLQSCSSSATCGSPLLGRFCEVASPCATNEYLDVFALAADYYAFTPGNEYLYCVTCPTGCASCILVAHEIVCTSCSVGYDQYEFFSLQNVSAYDSTDVTNVYLMKYLCKPTTSSCSAVQGFYPKPLASGVCVMCFIVDAIACTACPPNSYRNRVDDTCVDFCGDSQVGYVYGNESYCYNYPSFSVTEDYGSSTYTISPTTYNVATLSLILKISLAHTFNIQVAYGYCYLSVLSSIGIPHPTTPVVINTTINTDIALPSNSRFKALLASDTYSIYCSYYVQIDSRPVTQVTVQRSNIQQICQPSGSFSTTPTIGNSQTIFSTSVSSWFMSLIQSSHPTTIFTYEIYFVARNNLNLAVAETSFKLKTVSTALTPSLYPSDGVSLTSFIVKLSSNLENPIFNEVSMLLRVTPTIAVLAHLYKDTKIALNYSFTKDSAPKNSQRILIAYIFETQIDSKQTMKDIADQTLLARGSLPYDQENHEDLSLEKQASMLTKIGYTIACDDTVNCGDIGSCKRLNYNWYSMCQCPNGYTGEQCDWTDDDLTVAKQLLGVYLQAIIDDIPLLDASGESSTGLNGTEILTLLQVWTDTRDTFSASTFEKLNEIFSTESLSEVSEASRLLYVFDNMIDILRRVDISTDQFIEYETRITTNIMSTMRNMVTSLDTTVSTSVTIDESNFKGLLVHSDAFVHATSPVQLSLANNMTLTVPQSIVSSGEYLEVLIQPLDIMEKPIVKTADELTFILSNSLSITVKNLTTGDEVSVDSILQTTPLDFSMSYVLPSGYMAGFKNVTCIYWDEVNQEWSRNGVNFIQVNSEQTISCNTTHLTEFALANVDFGTDSYVDDSDLGQVFSTEYRISFIVFIVCLGLALFGLYAITVFVIKKSDIKDEERIEPIHHLKSKQARQNSRVFRGIFPGFFENQADEDFSQVDFDQSMSIASEGQPVQKNRKNKSFYKVKAPQNNEPPIRGHQQQKQQEQKQPKYPINQMHPNSPFARKKQLQKLQQQHLQQLRLEQQNLSTYPLNQSIELQQPQEYVKPQFQSKPKRQQQKSMNYPKNFSQKPKDSLVISEGPSGIADDIEPKREGIPPPMKIIGGEQDVEIPNHEGQFYGIDESAAKQNNSNEQEENKNNNNGSDDSAGKQLPENQPAVIKTKKPSQDVYKKIKPYWTLFCWKYSFDNISNSERVLFFVITISTVMFCASFYFEYINIQSSRELTFANIIIQSIIILFIYEVVLWFIVAIVGMKKLFSRQLCCCCQTDMQERLDSSSSSNGGSNSQDSGETTTTTMSSSLSGCACFAEKTKKKIRKGVYFFGALAIFVVSAVLIVLVHKDQSKRRFLIWAISTFLSVLGNFLVEFLALLLIVKFKMLCLLSFVKYKRLDF